MPISDCSEMTADELIGFRTDNAFQLLGIVLGHEFCKIDHIKRKYLEVATNFDATKNCLLRVGLLSQTLDELTANERQLWFDKDVFSRSFLELFLSNNSHAELVGDFLSKFSLSEKQLSLKPPRGQSEVDISIRELLVDCHYLTFSTESQTYVVNPEIFTILAKTSRTQSPTQLRETLLSRQELGDAAEKVVFEYEQLRIGESNSNRVKHVAKEDVNAGYDIQSIDSSQNPFLPRFIEVKAVSLVDFQFHWTRNEINMAKRLRTAYYLYLLPVSKNILLIDELMIIQDPIASVLQSASWNIEHDTISCRLVESKRDSG